jgi:hypothetical protein
MKKIISVLLAGISVLFFTSCEKVVGEGPVVTQTRNVSNFTRISVSIPGKVNYKIDPVYKVEVQAQQNILDILQTNMEGQELVIKIRDNKRVKEHEDIIVTISAPVATFVNLSGSAEFNLTGMLTGADLGLKISGSGSINVQHAALANKLSGTISGSGNINVLSGTAKNEDLRISGSGSIELRNVVAEKADIEISGSGDMRVNLTQNLKARISGSGSVYYRGNPAIDTHISGSGTVRPF